MEETFKAIPVSDRVYWVGAVDWGLRDFHGYATRRGSTYNAFLILGDKPILVDTVKAPFKEEMLARIASVIEPRKIRTIISNHSEMDHSGCLPEAIALIQPEAVYASPMGVKALDGHFRLRNITAIQDGQTLALGNATLRFLETRMLHWPDSMLTYLVEDQVLFSNDAFGMHLASAERFTDQLPWDVIEHEAAKYYANILMPLSGMVKKTVARLAELNLPLKLVATDHGPIWRRDFDKIINLYSRWAEHHPTRKAVIVYDTMWQSTAKMAQALAEGLLAGGASPQVMPLSGSDRSEVATEVLQAGALLVGSPTLNNNMFPTVADTLTYLKGLRPANLIGAAFGSYGWSGEVVGQLNEILKAMKVQLVSEGVKCVYVPTPETLAQCHALGLQVAGRLGEVSLPAASGPGRRGS